MVKFRLLCGAAFLAVGCVHADQPAPQDCPAPRLVPSALIIGDGARDKGFPGGVSLVDVDDDGDLDLFATGGYAPTVKPVVYRANTLYLNDGAGSFSHSADPEFSVADNPFSGSTWGDVDHDGDPDAFIGVQHKRPDIFLRNLGGGRFSREALGEATTAPGSNFAASWVDIDKDGDLDLMSGGPTLERAGPLLIYRNDGGAFARVTGVPIENGISNAGAVLWADYDNDGDQDLFVANTDIMRYSKLPPADFEAPQFYRNDGGWNFTRTKQPFNDRMYASPSAAAGDIDNDGDLDLYIGHVGYGHPDDSRDHVFLNDGAGAFAVDPRFESHLHATETTAAAFADFDGDGDLDLVATVYGEGVRLFANDGSGAFSLVEDAALLDRRASYWGAAAGDLDGDGDFDLVLGNWGETEQGEYITVLRNESKTCGAALRIVLKDRFGARDPIGARVTLLTKNRGLERRQVREAMGQSTFRSQSSDAFLFSVPHGERALGAEILWPDGKAERLTRLRFDRPNVVREKETAQ